MLWILNIMGFMTKQFFPYPFLFRMTYKNLSRIARFFFKKSRVGKVLYGAKKLNIMDSKLNWVRLLPLICWAIIKNLYVLLTKIVQHDYYNDFPLWLFGVSNQEFRIWNRLQEKDWMVRVHPELEEVVNSMINH